MLLWKTCKDVMLTTLIQVWSTKEKAEERCKELNSGCSPKNPPAWWNDIEVDNP